MKLFFHKLYGRLGLDTRTRLGAGLVVLALAWGGATTARGAVGFEDYFTNRQVLTGSSGQLNGSSAGTTLEPNEPKHGGKVGGHSMWVSWVAPTDGIATFWTDGSSFDTLLSAYYLQPGDTTMDKLRESARNDDAVGSEPASLIQFGALSGVRYEIAVDGYNGAAGDIRLRWDFVAATSPPPIIVSVPVDQAARTGETVTLTVDMQVSPNLDLQWRYNGNSFGATGPTLVLTDLQITNVGRYTLRIRLGDVRFETTPIEIQINSEGQTNALARDKLIDSLSSGLEGHLEGPGLAAKSQRPKGAAGVVRGYDGSQIFNTTYATTDPNEPPHCGLAPAASYWFTYRPPTNGTAVIDTVGSTYDNVLAAYTYTGTVTSYADLIPIACDHLGGPTALSSRIEFAVLKGQSYVIVLAGVNGARGIAHLNYHLDVSRPPLPPTLTNSPAPLTVAAGTNVDLSAGINGSPPLHFSWSSANVDIPNATNSVLQFINVAPTNSGNYVVSVWNHIGGPVNAAMVLRVVVAPQLQFQSHSGGATFSFATVAGQTYVIEQTESLGGTWLPLLDGFVGDGGQIVLTNAPEAPARFYRVRVP